MTEDPRSTGSGEAQAVPPPPPPAAPATPPAAPAMPPAVPPAVPPATAPVVADRPGISLLPIALGVGLLAAAIVVCAIRSRQDGDLDWSNFTVVIGATAVLALVALVARVVGSGRAREELVTWSGVVGILGVATTLGIWLEEVDGAEDWLPYVLGGLVVLLSVVGYAAVRRGAFVVTAILGLGVVYLQLCDDLLSDIDFDDNGAIVAACAVAVFVLAVTAVGWLLPTRALSGVVAGVIGVIGLNAVLLVLVAVQAFSMFFGGFDPTADVDNGGPPTGGGRSSEYDNDVYVILAIAAVLTLVWALAAALNGNPGFTVLAIAMPASIVPAATFVLAVEHPTWWGVGLAAAGAILLALAGLRQLMTRRKA